MRKRPLNPAWLQHHLSNAHTRELPYIPTCPPQPFLVHTRAHSPTPPHTCQLILPNFTLRNQVVASSTLDLLLRRTMSTSTMISLGLLRTSGHLYSSAARSLSSPSYLPHLEPVLGSTKKAYQGPPPAPMFISTKWIDLPPDIEPPPGVDPPPLGTPVPRPGPDFPRPPIPSPPKPDIPLPPPDVLPRQPPPEVDPPTPPDIVPPPSPPPPPPPPPPERKPPGSVM